MRLLELALLACSLATSVAGAASDDAEEPVLPPCTIKSSLTNSFFDLNRINLQPPDDDGKKASSSARESSWHARGYDYGANFTLNICGPVIEQMHNVVGIAKKDWGRIGAFYEMNGKNYSLGFNNSVPVLRGRKLVLNYTDGSPCPSSSRDRRARLPTTTETLHPTALDDDDDDGKHRGGSGGGSQKETDGVRRKTAIISLLCDREPTKPLAAAYFVASPDECTYLFEVRTIAACATVNATQQTLGPSGVFGVIAIIAILVYIIGGIVYQRVVMHQRGWRQIPNYALWASMAVFVKDVIIITGSSCVRCLPGGRSSRRWLGGSRPGASGYGGLNGSPTVNGNGSAGLGRGGRGISGSDDENRLIDQLDEEWDD